MRYESAKFVTKTAAQTVGVKTFKGGGDVFDRLISQNPMERFLRYFGVVLPRSKASTRANARCRPHFSFDFGVGENHELGLKCEVTVFRFFRVPDLGTGKAHGAARASVRSLGPQEAAAQIWADSVQ